MGIMNKSIDPDKILVVTSYDFNGRYFRDLANSFDNQGQKLSILSTHSSSNPTWAREGLINNVNFGMKVHSSFLLRLYSNIKLIKKFDPTIIQTHLFEAGIIGLIAGKILKIPVIHTRHHIDEHFQSGTFLHRRLDRLVAQHSNHVVVFSVAAKKWLVEIEKILDSHITVINQGFDFSRLTPSLQEIESAKNDLGFSDGQVDIICVARYSKVKGQNYLVEAFCDIQNLVPNITLTFIGPGNSRWITDQVNSLGISEAVKILPERDDITACIAAADFVVHPSLADSFSQLIIEAQAVGGVLIATDIAAAREQIVDGVTGLIVPPRDSQAITEAVLRLIADPNKARAMREQAAQHVREKFTLVRMYEESISCLELFSNSS